MKRDVLIFVLVLLLLSKVSFADVVINEVMAAPNQCSDYYCEWVEVYNPTNKSINLINWKICGNELLSGYINHTDNILYLNTTTIIPPLGYAIITDGGSGTEVYDNFNVSNESLAYHVDSSEICGRLTITNEKINITNGSYSDIFIYNASISEGYTLEKINPNGTNEKSNWVTSLVEGGTPGYQNSVYGTGEIDYSQIEISEFLPDPEGDDDAPMPDGEWIELYNPTNSAMDLKWMFFKDLYGHFLYITDTTVSGTTIVPPRDYLVVYTNGQSGFLNNEDAETLSFYDRSGNLIQNVSYINPVEGHSYAYVEGIGWQHTKPTPGEENINYSGVKDSRFKITDVYDLGTDNKARFGQTIRVRVNVYKGNDSKNVVRLYAADENDKISKESKISIYTRFTNYTLTVPVQLKPNCNEEYDDGIYDVFIGWTSESSAYDSFPINVKGITGSMCDTVTVEKKTTSGQFSYELVEVPEEITAGEKFDLAVRLDNNGDADIPVKIWSYVYRGSKSYSGDREENKKEFVLKGMSSDVVELSNIVTEADAGDYRLKVVINRDEQKTNKQITEDIKIAEESVEEISLGNEMLTESQFEEALQEERITSNVVGASGVVYESTTEKAKKLVLLFFIFVSVFLNILLIWWK